MNRRACLAGVKAAALLWLALAGSGCVPARGYFTDRWRDAKDIFTASVGAGVGAKARVGPVHVGLILVNSECYGLRCGEFGKLGGDTTTGELELLLLPMPLDKEWLFALEAVEHCGERDKSYVAVSQIPFVTTRAAGNLAYYTQIEVVAGLGGTVRLGFNPGELLDFVLGWFNIDIYSDDLEARRYREEKKKAKEKPKEAPTPPAPTETGPPAPQAP